VSQVTLWAHATWDIDRWVKPGVFSGFSPAAEVVKDGDDASRRNPVEPKRFHRISR
jgi:HSP20 family protein